MNLSKQSPVARIGNRPPVKRMQGADGRFINEKIPATPYTRKFVTPSGNVVRVPLATGRTIGTNPADNPYGLIKSEEKFRQGFLLYAECPYATGRLPTPKGTKPCTGTNPERPGTFWSKHPQNASVFIEDTCCDHIESIIELRQKDHAAKQLEVAESFKTPQDRMIESMHAERMAAPPARRRMFEAPVGEDTVE